MSDVVVRLPTHLTYLVNNALALALLFALLHVKCIRYYLVRYMYMYLQSEVHLRCLR